jgi:putative ABC transport system permease protein
MPEVDRDADGQPLASEEIYVAARLRKRDGGETNVPIRGVGQATLALRGVHLTMVAGRPIREGQDEVMVGRALTHRIQHCELGDVIVFNTTPLRVVGIFAHEGPLESEIWGDLERIREALDRPPGCSRLLVQLRPDADLEALAARLEEDERTPASIFTEQKYLEGQTEAMSTMLGVLARILGVIMGVAAIFTGANTMQAALAARSHEVGILLALGYRPFSIFVSFLFEAMVLGLLGGLVGCLFVLPLHGIRTGTTNWQSFTEVAFAFRVTPGLLLVACGFAAGLGLLGGALPALRAADLDVVEALRRG